MGYFRPGDVVLAPVAFKERGSAKTRPAIVIASSENGDVHICPISSRPPADAAGIPISLYDFSEGGLDLFSESYVLTSRVQTIRSGEVIGKRGRLTQEAVTTIVTHLPVSLQPENSSRQKLSRSGSQE